MATKQSVNRFVFNHGNVPKSWQTSSQKLSKVICPICETGQGMSLNKINIKEGRNFVCYLQIRFSCGHSAARRPKERGGNR